MASLFTTAELESLMHLSSNSIDAGLGYLLHEQAVAYLEGEVGVQLSQHTGVTIGYTPRWDDVYIDLPVPTTAVSSVSVDGTEVASTDYQLLDSRLYRRVGWGGSRWMAESRFAYRSSVDDYVSVDVTLTYGYDTPPAEFKTYGLILAAQAYQMTPNLNRQSVRIDDFAETYATAGSLVTVGMELPPKALGRLKARYGRRNAQVVESR